PPKFKTLIGGFEAVSICEDTGKLIDVFDVATHDTDIFTRLCGWLNQQGGDSPIHAVIKNTGDPILDCDDYSQSWINIMAQLADFPTRELIAHQGLKPH
ncbi:hypothetical protein, partial [uncultured Vibrio sp.]|uniref:hypothetical protein n=1 Tax=uncultured Vibrio sp. TaxID=114054 RepID=UPI00261C8B8E